MTLIFFLKPTAFLILIQMDNSQILMDFIIIFEIYLRYVNTEKRRF
jgi:hypothetical protein